MKKKVTKKAQSGEVLKKNTTYLLGSGKTNLVHLKKKKEKKINKKKLLKLLLFQEKSLTL